VLGNHLLGRFGFRRYNTAAVAAKLAVLFVTVSLAGLLGLGLRGCMVAAIVGEIVVITAMAVAVVKRRPRVNARLLRSMLAYGVRVQIGAVFQLMNYRLDVLILSLFRPLRQVGYYVIAEAIAELVLAVGRAFQSALMPTVVRSETDRDRAAASIAGSRGHAIAALFAIAGTAVAGPAVIYFGYGARFAPAIVPTLILLPAMWFLGSGNVVSADLRGRGRPGLSSALSGAAVVVTVVLDLVLIPPFGMIGAAIASVIAYTMFGCLSLLVLSSLSGCSIAMLCIPSRNEFRAVARLVQRPRALRGT
jgi:O-antigen/teichoic acid export membrane protein